MGYDVRKYVQLAQSSLEQLAWQLLISCVSGSCTQVYEKSFGGADNSRDEAVFSFKYKGSSEKSRCLGHLQQDFCFPAQETTEALSTLQLQFIAKSLLQQGSLKLPKGLLSEWDPPHCQVVTQGIVMCLGCARERAIPSMQQRWVRYLHSLRSSSCKGSLELPLPLRRNNRKLEFYSHIVHLFHGFASPTVPHPIPIKHSHMLLKARAAVLNQSLSA